MGDRYETIATAIASTYLNIPLAHLQGGEVSGNLDEMVRHSITKLASYHFTTSKKSQNRVIKMGEEVDRVYFTGCPGMDLLKFCKKKITKNFFSQVNYTGKKFLFDKKYLLVINHPISTENKKKNLHNIVMLLKSLTKIDIHKIMFWPNADAYSDVISSTMRTFREKYNKDDFTFLINTTPENYANLLYNASCLVGNSSSFIREGSQLGVPALILGKRQINREMGKNVIISDYEPEQIIKKIQIQLKKKKFKEQRIYGNGNAAKLIVRILEKLSPSIKKQITY